MSRLDDELKRALRRQEPQADFLASVLARINEGPAPRPTVWQRLAALFELPKMRFAVAGAALALLIITGAAVFSQLRDDSPGPNQGAGEQATVAAPGPDNSAGEQKSLSPQLQAGAASELTAPQSEPKPREHKKIEPRRRFVRSGMMARRHGPRQAEPKVSPEAEAAKVRVLFALQIASSTLKEAQRVIQEDSQNTKPDPMRNR